MEGVEMKTSSRITIISDAVTCVPRELDKIQYCVDGTEQSPSSSIAAVETSSRQSPRLLLGDSVMLPHLMLHYNLWKPTSFGSLILRYLVLYFYFFFFC